MNNLQPSRFLSTSSWINSGRNKKKMDPLYSIGISVGNPTQQQQQSSVLKIFNISTDLNPFYSFINTFVCAQVSNMLHVS